MGARTRPLKVIFERETVTQNEYGEEIGTAWTPICEEMATPHYGRGDERRQAAQEQGNQTATFVVMDNVDTRGVLITDRIQAIGSVWNIAGLSPSQRRQRHYLEFTAKRAL